MQAELWQVGEYTVSPTANTIQRAGEAPIKLPPRLIDTLLFFASHPGEVISRKELVENLWNRSIVTDKTVTQNIFELRKSLRAGRGRSEAREYLITIPKRGYQLVAEVTPPRPAEQAAAPADSAEMAAASEAASAAAKEGAAAAAADSPEKAGESGSEGRRGLRDWVRSLWLDESSAGFKRAAY